jgi:hypothetical protein
VDDGQWPPAGPLRAVVIAGYGSLFLGMFGFGLLDFWPLALLAGILGAVLAAYLVVLGASSISPRFARLGGEVLVLGLYMACDLIDDLVPPPGPLARPEVFGVAIVYLFTVAAYAVSRRHEGPLPPFAELSVQALLVVGILIHVTITVQMGPRVLLGTVPGFTPILAPPLTVFLYALEIEARLRRWAAEAAAVSPAPKGSAFRAAPLHAVLRRRRPHRWILPCASALAIVLLALCALFEKAFLGWSPLQVVTRTQGFTFSGPAPAESTEGPPRRNWKDD